MAFEDVEALEVSISYSIRIRVNYIGIGYGSDSPLFPGSSTEANMFVFGEGSHTACETCEGFLAARVYAFPEEPVPPPPGSIAFQLVVGNCGNPIPPGRILIEFWASSYVSLGIRELLGDIGYLQSVLDLDVLEVVREDVAPPPPPCE